MTTLAEANVLLLPPFSPQKRGEESKTQGERLPREPAPDCRLSRKDVKGPSRRDAKAASLQDGPHETRQPWGSRCPWAVDPWRSRGLPGRKTSQAEPGKAAPREALEAASLGAEAECRGSYYPVPGETGERFADTTGESFRSSEVASLPPPDGVSFYRSVGTER